MTAPADFTQRVREALVEVLDTLPAIVALTGRASLNIVAAEDLAGAQLPAIGYVIGRVQQLTATDYRVPVTFTAAATDAATVNALLNVIDGAVSNPKLLQASYPIDSYRERWDEGREDAARADDADCYAGSIDISFVGSAVDPVVPTTVTVLPAAFTLAVAGTQQLTATVRDALGALIPGAPLAWTSSKPTKASIDPVTGLVTWLDGGLMGDSVVFTATCTMVTGSASGTSTGTIAAVRVPTTVTVTPSSFSVVVGATQQLGWTVFDQFGVVMVGQAVTFASLAPAKATVSGGGLVTGVSIGPADITVTAGSAVGTAAATVASSDYLLMTWPGADAIGPAFVADTGQSFAQFDIGTAAVFSRQNNKAYLSTAGSNYSGLVADAAHGDGTITQVFAPGGISGGIVFRYVDKDNYFYLEIQTTGSPFTFTLYRRQSGVFTQIGIASGIVMASGDAITIVLNGSSIAVKGPTGTTIISATDSFQSSATKIGLAINAVTALRYGQLRMVA